jgi:hypothetical protein
MADLGVGKNPSELLSEMKKYQNMIEGLNARGAEACRGRSRSPDPLARPSPKPEDLPRALEASQSPQNRRPHVPQGVSMPYDDKAASDPDIQNGLSPVGDNPFDQFQRRTPRTQAASTITINLCSSSSSSDEEAAGAPSNISNISNASTNSNRGRGGSGGRGGRGGRGGGGGSAGRGKKRDSSNAKAKKQRKCPWIAGLTTLPCKFSKCCPACCSDIESALMQRTQKNAKAKEKRAAKQKTSEAASSSMPKLSKPPLSEESLAKVAHKVFMHVPAWNSKDGFHSEIRKHHLFGMLDGLQDKTLTILEQVSCANLLAIMTKVLDDQMLDDFDSAAFLRKLHAAMQQHATSAQQLPDVAATESEEDEDHPDYVSDECSLTPHEQKKPCWCKQLKCWETYVDDKVKDWREETYPWLYLQDLTEADDLLQERSNRVRIISL